jgi:hypothetical protein
MPLPAGSSARAAVVNDQSGSASAATKRKQSLEQANKDLRAENKRLRSQNQSKSGNSFAPQSSSGGGGKGAGRGGKSQGKGQGYRSIRMPAGLVGKSHQTAAGEPICFSYNLPGGCTQASPGSKCAKGWHVCAEPGCSATHSLVNHKS